MPPKRKAASEAPVSKGKPSSSKKDSKADESTSKKAKPAYVKVVPELTKEEFLEAGHEFKIVMGADGEIGELTAQPTVFSTGSFGWKSSGKMAIAIDVNGVSKELQVQVGVNITVSGSRPDKTPASKSNGKKGKVSKKAAADEDEDDDDE